MPSNTAVHTPVHLYVEVDPDYFAAYEAYQPDARTLDRVAAVQPAAHIVVASRYSCRDCARNMPRMARIAEHLPGWTWEVFSSETGRERMAALGITMIPTFVVYEYPDGRELGRIVENPASGSLEIDLLEIVTGAPNLRNPPEES